MADKKFFNKRKKNNRNNRFIPSQIDRIDKELLQEISVLLSISPGIDEKTICNHYGITDRQLQYIKDHQQKWDIIDKITKNGRE